MNNQKWIWMIDDDIKNTVKNLSKFAIKEDISFLERYRKIYKTLPLIIKLILF